MVMNTTVIVTVISGFITIIGILLGWYVKRNADTVRRNDEAVQLTQRSMRAIANDFALFNALKYDFWDLERWAHDTALRWDMRERDLHARGLIDTVMALPPIPPSRMAQLEREQAMHAETEKKKDA
jgi:hypothetical protein